MPIVAVDCFASQPRKVALIVLLSAFSCLVSSLVASDNWQVSGNSELEITAYSSDGQFSRQHYHGNFSLALKPEFYWEADKGDDNFIFTPFLRFDQRDDERSHGDIRELSWTQVRHEWEFHGGIRKVFWGVTEFNHLVDIINQTDGVESFDGEEKLGQPMVAISKVNPWGIIDAYILLGFRERTFAGAAGRLRGSSVIDADRAQYESGREEEHIDFALRWSHSFNVFDLGLYRFDGTDRAPLLNPLTVKGTTVLIPYYQQMSQTGMDLQATIDSWLWKLEAIHKDTTTDNYLAAQAGFEYTFYGIRESVVDIGVLLEYGWDERGENATAIAQNDLYLGARLTLNDADDSTLLAGISYDQDYHTRSLLLEASRRLNDRWTIALEGLAFVGGDDADQAAALDEGDRIQLVLERYF